MSSYVWNFINSFSFDKPLASYSVEELNVKLRELDMDKHLDTLEKAFEVQKVIIEKLKQENDVLKKEIRELKSKFHVENSEVPIMKIPYPELRTVLTYVKWSSLENNALESRIVDQFRQRLIGHLIELEVQPFGGDKTIIQPLIVFCTFTLQLTQDVDRLMMDIRDKSIGPLILLVTREFHSHEMPSVPSSPVPHHQPSSLGTQATANSHLPASNVSAKMLQGVAAKHNVKYILDMHHQNRRLATLPSNEHSIQACVSIIKNAQI